MDDIDYSMMIAERDWRSFYEECEECRLVQPVLAAPDGKESGTCTALKDKMNGDKSTSSAEEDPITEEDPGVTCSRGETGDDSKLTDATAKLETEDKQIQTEGTPEPKAADEKDPEPLKRTNITFRQERERWFVTVNDSPSQLCRRAVNRKRPKKVAKNRRTRREGNKGGGEMETESDQASEQGCFDPQIENSEDNRGVMMHSTESEEFEDAVEFLSELTGQGFLSAAKSQEEILECEAEEACSTGQPPSESHDDDRTWDGEISTSKPAGEDLSSGGDQTNHRPEEARQLSPPPAVTVTAPDSPESFAQAAGHMRPVYAISAFWDEMEKLTINDILQLRMARSPPLVGAEESPAANTEGYCSPSQTETSDNADSDYYTQADESKPDRSSWDFSTSDFEEECWQFGASRSPDPLSKDMQRENPTSEDSDSTCSAGRETPVPPEDSAGHTSAEEGMLIEEVSRRMRKSKSLRNMTEIDLDDLLLVTMSAEDREVHAGGQLRPASLLPDMLVQEGFTDALNAERVSTFGADVCSAYDVTMDREFPNFYPAHGHKPIPIFSSSHPTVRELTSPNLDQLFLSFMKKNFSPIRIVSNSLMQTSEREALAAGGSGTWLSLRAISFADKGCIWSKLAVQSEKKEVLTVISDGRLGGRPLGIIEDVAAPEQIPETMKPSSECEPVRLEHLSDSSVLVSFPEQGVLSTLRQSDMCLVCIAFASWVLTSSDPDNTDAWKAALLANLSAFSAIQYLRHYMRRRSRPPHGP